MEKHEGFRGQRVYFAPAELKENLARHPLAVGLQAIHMGMFPAARHHSITRPCGAPEAVLIYAHSGRGSYEVDGVEGPVEAGDVLFLPPGTRHRYAADSKAPWSIYWAHFSGTIVPPLFAQLPKGTYSIRPSKQARDEMVPLLRKCLNILQEGQTLRSTLATSHLLRAVIGCCLFLGHQSTARRSQDPQDLAPVLRLMQDHPTRALSLQQLARQAHLSPSRFSALFRSRTGTSPVQYHLRLRMQAACQLLDASPADVKEIADRCGYSDPYYFSRLFKKVTGLSPSAYRQEQKG